MKSDFRSFASRLLGLILCIALVGCVTDRELERALSKEMQPVVQNIVDAMLIASVAHLYRQSTGAWPTNFAQLSDDVSQLAMRFNSDATNAARPLSSSNRFAELALTPLTNGNLSISYRTSLPGSNVIKFIVTPNGDTAFAEQFK